MLGVTIFGMTLFDLFANITVFLMLAWFCSAVLKNKSPVISTLIGTVMYGIVMPVLSIQPIYVETVPAWLRYAVVMLVFWLYVRLNFIGTFKEKLLAYVIGYSVISIAQIISTAILSVLRVDVASHMGWLLALSTAMTMAILYFVSRVWKSVTLVLGRTRFLTFFLLPVCQFGLVCITVFVMSKSDAYNHFLAGSKYVWVSAALGAVFLLSLVADGLVLEGVSRIANSIQEKERLKTLELENQLTYEYIKNMESDITEMRKYRHDYVNMLTAVQLAMENGAGGSEEALQLVRQMNSGIGSVTGKHYCECTIVNCLLAHEEKQLTEGGIKSDLRAELPEQLEVNELDLCRVVTNLFDNARESCLRMPEGQERRVRSNMRMQEGYLYITVHNSCADDELSTETTRKKDTKQHGLGLKIIRELAAKHGGELVITRKPGAVEMTVTLRWGS